VAVTQIEENRHEEPAKHSMGALAIVLLVLAGFFLFVANVLLWADSTLFDTGEFTEATENALAKQDVQRRMGEVLAAEVVQSPQLQKKVEEQVPPNLSLAVPVVANQLEPLIADIATRFIASERTGRLASDVIPVLHTELVAFLEDDDKRLQLQGDSLVLHLSGTVDNVGERLGVPLGQSEGGDGPEGDVVLIKDATYLQLTSDLVKNRQEITLALLVGAIASLGVAAWRIGNITQALQKVSIVLVAVGVASLLALLVSNWILADVFPDRIVIRELLKSFEANLEKQSLILVILGAIGIATMDARARHFALNTYNGAVNSGSSAIGRIGVGPLMLAAAALIIILVLIF
jgi:hypothetical protein